MKKLLALILALAMLLTLCVGCGVQKEEPSGDEIVSEELPVIRYGAFLDMLKSSLIYIAVTNGYDIEEGVDVELVNVSKSAEALTSLITEKDEIDMWGMQIMPTCTFIGNGADLVIFGGNVAEGGAMISAKGQAQQYRDDLNNLKGKTILGIRGETGVLALIAKLVEMGFDVNKDITIKWADAPGVLEGVSKGEGDVGCLPIEYTYFGDDVNAEVVFQTGEVAENYICCRMTTTRKILDERREDLKNVVKAEIRAYKFMQENKAETVKLLAEYSGQDEAYVEQNVYNVRISFVPDPYANAVGPFYNVLGLLDMFESADATGVDVMDHVDVSLYKDALDELMEEYPGDACYEQLLEIFNRQNSVVIG